MGYQSGSRRGGFQKTSHEKKKNRVHKIRGKKQILEEKHADTAGEITEKTLSSLKRLSEQKFAVSPFSRYFDDWLLNLKEVLSEFETNPDITVDDVFMKERERIIAKIEEEFNGAKQREATLNESVRELADKNHRLVELDDEYAANTRDLGPKNNAELKELTHEVHHLEEELEDVRALKTSFFGFTKIAKAKREIEVQGRLGAARKAVEEAIEKFKAEQEELHDEYEKKKQAVIEEVQALEKEVEKLETDVSVDVRQAAGEELIKAINELFHRKPAF
jgi:predicted  nucleic acid-binding Zn-ribbon protein